MTEIIKTIVTRSAPALAGTLVTYGVQTAHADAIALGLAALVITVFDIAIKHWSK